MFLGDTLTDVAAPDPPQILSLAGYVEDDPLGVFLLGCRTLDYTGDAGFISIFVTHISMMIEMVILRPVQQHLVSETHLLG